MDSIQQFRTHKVQAFRKKVIRISNAPTEKSEEDPSQTLTTFEQFQCELENDYKQVVESQMGDLQIQQSNVILQQKIKEYLRHYWFNKIYHRRKNAKKQKIEQAKVQSKQQEIQDRELKYIASKIDNHYSRKCLMQVIKGKVYFLQRAQPPQGNLINQQKELLQTKSQYRKSQVFTGFTTPVIAQKRAFSASVNKKYDRTFSEYSQQPPKTTVSRFKNISPKGSGRTHSLSKEFSKIMDTCKTFVSDTKQENSATFNFFDFPENLIEKKQDYFSLKKLNQLYHQIENESGLDQAIGFDPEQPLLKKHMSRIKENFKILERENQRKKYFLSKKQQPIFVPFSNKL